MVTGKAAETVSVATSNFSALCKDFEDGEAHNSVTEDIDHHALGGFLDMVSAAFCHLLGQYCVVKLY